MKITSYPPMIILLDMLFVFLFILVLNEKKIINIHIPDDKLFKGGKIVYFDPNTKTYKDSQGAEYQFSSIYNLLLDECKEQEECKEAKEKFGDGIRILLPKNLFDEMAKINMLAFGTKSCSKLDFFVKEDGFLDYKKTIEQNPCLEKISGFKKSFYE
jgi:hypothetical protein